MQLDCGRGCWTGSQVLRQSMVSCLQLFLSEALASMLHRLCRLGEWRHSARLQREVKRLLTAMSERFGQGGPHTCILHLHKRHS